MTCRHCTKGKVTRPRGLCHRCHGDTGVRALYPVTCKTAPKPEPTAQELDELVAEQSKPENLPPWWHEEKCQAREHGYDTKEAA